MTSLPTADHELDCRGALCPMPIIRLREAIDAIEAGAVIRLLATDPASVNDMPAFARNTGHELLSASSKDGVYEYFFRKAGGSQSCPQSRHSARKSRPVLMKL